MGNACWRLIYRLRTWRGFLSLLWLEFKSKWALVALGIAFGIFGLYQAIPSQLHSRTFDAFATASLLVSGFLLYKDFVNLSRSLLNIESLDFEITKTLEKVELPKDHADESWKYEKETHPWGVAVYSREINQAIRERASEIRLETDPRPFDVFDRDTGVEPDVVKKVSPYLLREAFKGNSILFNSAKVRLCSDLLLPKLKEPSPSLTVRRTDYFSSLCTNEAALRRIYLRKEMILMELQLLAADAKLPVGGPVVLSPLRQSPCSNHIGVSTIGITEDGHVACPVQTRRSAQSANRIAPTGSGSADYADLKGAGCLKDFLVTAMEREMRSECGIREPGIKVRTEIIGYARLLHRGGKPEFFGVSWIYCTMDTLEISAEEALFQSTILRTPTARDGESIPQGNVRKEISDLRDLDGGAFSFLLHLNLKFLEEYLKEKKNAIPGDFGAFRS